MSELPLDPDGNVLGWRFDLEDHAALEAESLTLLTPPATYAAPAFVDPRKNLRVENQGQIGSCSGNARTTVEELVAYLQTGAAHQFSRMGAYLAAQKVDGLLGRDSGATINGQARAAKAYGTAPESVFPYPSSYHATIPEAYWAAAAEHKTRATVKLRSYRETFDFLGRGIGGVVIGVPWTTGMSAAGQQGGVIERCDGATVGGHAVAVVGYRGHEHGGRSDRQGRPYAIFAQSWGTRWGDNGWGWFAPYLFDQWGQSRGCEMIGFSDIADPNDDGFIQRDWFRDAPWPFSPNL